MKDVAKAVAFYEAAFGLARRFVHETGQYAEMETGSTRLAFASANLAKSNLPEGFRENVSLLPTSTARRSMEPRDTPGLCEAPLRATSPNDFGEPIANHGFPCRVQGLERVDGAPIATARRPNVGGDLLTGQDRMREANC